MDYVTIKSDEYLKTVCRITETTEEVFIKNTLDYLGFMEVINDSSEEWGRTIGQCLNEYYNQNAVLGIQLLALNTNDSVAMEAFCNLLLIGPYDCPECGSETEKFTDSDNGKDIFQVERCECGHEEIKNI